MNQLTSLSPRHDLDLREVDLVQAFLAGRNPRTLAAYRKDLRDFQIFTGAPTVEAGVTLLISNGPGRANALALSYRVHLQERSLAPATINRRLAALRSVVKLGQTLGFIAWTLQVPSLRSVPYRDTKGPGIAGVRAMLAHLAKTTGPSAKRDLAMLRCMFGLGLRRGELLGLDYSHINLEEGYVLIQGKGRLERERMSVPPRTLEALKSWIADRGTWDGPIFCALHAGHHGHRLNGSTLFRLVRNVGRAVGVETRPHGIRHSAITKALDATGGNVRSVQKFSRHAKVETVGRYDDARSDLAGEVAILVDLGA